VGTAKPAGPAGSASPHDAARCITLRAVVAAYRSAVPAYTLIATPAALLALCASGLPPRAASDPRAHAHQQMLRDYVRDSGALPGAVVVAVAGGRMRCETDHLYALDLEPHAGDRLILLDGSERLAELARSPWGACQTYVSAVPWQGCAESFGVAPVALDGAMAAMIAQAPKPAGEDGDGILAAIPDAADSTAAATVRCAAARWANAVRVWH